MSETLLITGVSSGLGLGLAAASLDRGDRVFGLSRRSPGLVGRRGFTFLSLDLARLEAIPDSVSRLLQGVKSLDTIILNAGILGRIADQCETEVAELQAVMQVNVWANKVLLDALFSQGVAAEQVVGISSGASVSGARGWSGYSVSKAALNMLVKLYAAERPQTHFSAVAPGLVDTAMQDYARAFPADPRFPSMDRLKRASGTPDMPAPEVAAPRLLAYFKRLRNRPSGGFYDIRTAP